MLYKLKERPLGDSVDVQITGKKDAEGGNLRKMTWKALV
jgi:hypothetical protein